MSSCAKRFEVDPDKNVRLKDHDPDDTSWLDDKAEAKARTAKNVEGISEQQYHLWAENERALLVVFQAMDTAGKDGVIRNVFSGINPQGVRVTSFKKPSDAESDRDFLWRIHAAVPAKGEIGVFNRSHYEDVLVVRVHDIVPKKVWQARYEQINRFEGLLDEGHVRTIKFFLHISKDEQKKRLEDRIHDPEKNWKITSADLSERGHWDEYMEAYEEALSRCSTKVAPWYVVPANKKWFRDAVVSEIIRETLDDMDPKLPEPLEDVSKLKVLD